MMPSIGASFANSQTNRSGGFFQPIHATGASRASQRNDITDDNSAEATAKTDMGGGLFGGLGGGGDGGGFGVGGLVSGIAGLFGGKSKGAVGSDAAASAGEISTGGRWLPLVLIGGAALAVVVLLFSLKD